jgi:hypothetical protein
MAPLVAFFDLPLHTRHTQRVLASLFLGLCAVVFGSAANGQGLNIEQDIDPDKVVGHQECAECHKSEIAAWEKSHHHTVAWSLLQKGEANEIAKALGIASATADVGCTTCHGTQQKAANLKVVSCESCHGAAGGDPGWFKAHHDFGDGLDPKDPASPAKETEEHYKQRLATCDKLGMRRSENLYALAKNCHECHHVPSETLVNKGKHPVGSKGFEFMSWSQGEVRHNYQLDQTKNAEAPTLWMKANGNRTAAGHKRLMYVVGQLAALEVSLQNRAQATGRGDFLNSANGGILDGQKSLKAIDKAVPIPEVKAALDAVKPAKRTSIRKITPDDKGTYGDMAKAVADAGQKAAAAYDGNGWEKLDSLLEKNKPKGNVHQP